MDYLQCTKEYTKVIMTTWFIITIMYMCGQIKREDILIVSRLTEERKKNHNNHQALEKDKISAQRSTYYRETNNFPAYGGYRLGELEKD